MCRLVLCLFSCREKVDFYFPPHTTSIALAIHPSPAVSVRSATSPAVPRVKVFDGNDGGPYMSSVTFPNLPPPNPASLGGTFNRTREGVDTTTTLHDTISPPP